jgi:hypothetical protein
MSTYTEDYLVEQPAIQLMQHELGWDVVNCYGEWDGGKSDLGRDGKGEVVLTSGLKSALHRLNPDLPSEAIEGAVEEMGILNDECWIMNGRGRSQKATWLIWALRIGVAALFDRCLGSVSKSLITSEFFCKLKTSV